MQFHAARLGLCVITRAQKCTGLSTIRSLRDDTYTAMYIRVYHVKVVASQPLCYLIFVPVYKSHTVRLHETFTVLCSNVLILAQPPRHHLLHNEQL